MYTLNVCVNNTEIFLYVIHMDKYHSKILFSLTMRSLLCCKGSPSESMRVHFPSFYRHFCVAPCIAYVHFI